MAMLYALLSNTNLDPGASFVEGVDLDSMTVQTIIPLGHGYPTAFAVSAAQQRVYVVDPSNSEVRVYDTAGPLLNKTTLGSPPWDCALTDDGSRLIVSTPAGLVALSTSSLAIAKSVAGPYSPPSNGWPPWIQAEESGIIALSPDSNALIVCRGYLSPDSPKSPPPSWLVDASSLATIQSFGPPPDTNKWWWSADDVTFAGDLGMILFLAAGVAVVALDTQTGALTGWTQLEGYKAKPCLNALAYSASTGRVYVPTGKLTGVGKIFNPYLWIVDPVASKAKKVEGFNGAPYVPCVDEKGQSVYVTVRQALKHDRLARYDVSTSKLEPSVYEFSIDLPVVAMQMAEASVFEPGRPAAEHLYAEQCVEILIGLTGGGGGWVITPHGIIKPEDPAPIQPSDRALRDRLVGVLRASQVIRTAMAITDRAARDQVTNNALRYARAQLARIKVKSPGTQRRHKR